MITATEWQPFFISLPIAVINDVFIMNQTILVGHAPAVRARRVISRFDVRKACIKTLSIVRRKAVTLAVMSAVTVYAGVLLDSAPITYSAALVALGFVRLANSGQKGGEL